MIRITAAVCCLAVALVTATVCRGAGGPEGAGGTAGVREQLANGDRQLEAGRIDKAIEAYRKAVEAAPRSAVAHYKLGDALGRVRNYKEAIRQLEAAVKLEPDNVRFQRSLAGAYEAQGMVVQAQGAYQRVIGMTSNAEIIADAEKRFTLITARAYTEQGQPRAALTLLKQLAEKMPRDPEVIYYIGIVQMLSNHPDEAEAAFKKVIGMMANNVNAYLNLVKVLEQKDELDKAIDYQQRLLHILNPKSKEYEAQSQRLDVLRGRNALEKGRLKESEAAFNKALAINPGDPYANYGIAVVYQQEKRLSEAAEHFKKVLAVLPGHLDARLRLGTVYLELNRLREGVTMLEEVVTKAGNTPQGRQARNILERVRETLQRRRGTTAIAERIRQLKAMIARDPNQLEARMQLGELYLKTKDLKAAQEQYQAVVKIEPSNENAHGNLGQIYETHGTFKKAVEEYAITVSLEPNPDRAEGIARLLLLALGKQYYGEQHSGRALSVFRQVLAAQPENTVALFYIGLIHMNQDELEDAIDVLKNLVSISPNNLAARINLGLAYERLNRDYDAIHQYRYIMQRSPDSKISKEAETRLKLVEKRIKGFFASMNYNMVYDSNSSLSARSSQNYRTDFLLNFSYRYKTDNDFRYSVSWAPQYSVYHVGQFDFLTDNFTVSLAKVMARQTLSGGYTFRIQNGLLSGVRVSTSSTVFFESDQSFRMPSIVRWGADHPVATSVRLDAFYTDLDTTANDFFSAKTITLGLSFNQQIDSRQAMSLSYYYTRNRNKKPVGSDNAYNSQHLRLNYQRRLFPRVSMGISYGVLFYHYVNPDSFSNFTRRRSNITNLLSMTLSYGFRPNMSFYLNYSYENNHSNLPVGFVFSAQQRAQGQQNNAPGTIIGVQSTALGNFSRQAVTAGMSWNF